MNTKSFFNSHKDTAAKILKDKNSANDFITKVMNKINSVEALQNIVEDVRLLGNIVIDYVKGNYKKIPGATITTIVLALLYIMIPTDVIPDVLPGVGLLDDASVIALLIKNLHSDLQAYADWKGRN